LPIVGVQVLSTAKTLAGNNHEPTKLVHKNLAIECLIIRLLYSKENVYYLGLSPRDSHSKRSHTTAP
jgi:hypothetical protein